MVDRQSGSSGRTLGARYAKIGAISWVVSVVFLLASCKTLNQVAHKLQFSKGVAVSLNALEKSGVKTLPPMLIRGGTIDPRGDWIIFGDYDPKQKQLPIDAVKVAVRAVRVHLQPPGVDIRPTSSRDRHTQKISYFGGIAGTIVGDWFQFFDAWMKRAGLEDTPLIPEIPAYWRQVVNSAEQQKVLTAFSFKDAGGTRFWLCAGEFTGKEEIEKKTITFESTPLHVFAERAMDQNGRRETPSCATEGTDDPLADQYARALTANLMNQKLEGLTPIAEIRSFARLVAAINWMSRHDPYRDLSPWLAPVTPVNTPTAIQTIAKTHKIVRSDERMIHTLRIEISGGVTMEPTLVLGAGGQLLKELQQVVLAGRSAAREAIWNFKFNA